MTGLGVVLLARDRTIHTGSYAARRSAQPRPPGRSSCWRFRTRCMARRSSPATATSTRCSRRRICRISSGIRSGRSRATRSVIVIAIAAPWVLKRYGSSRTAWWLLVFAVATLACYLPYVVFDAWWYTRFLLPALPPFLALTAAVAHPAVDRSPPPRDPVRPPGHHTIVTLLLPPDRPATSSASAISNGGSGPSVSASRRCLPRPRSSRCTTAAASGSTRGDSTLGWADIDKGRLDDAVIPAAAWRTPYLLFERWEEPQFRERFAGERLGALDWPPRPRSTASGSTTPTITTGSDTEKQ